MVQQNFIRLRLLANRFCRGLNDIDKQLDLNSFKNADINHLETSLPQMLNQIRVYPTHSINHSTPGSGGVHTTGATSGGASSLSATDRQQLNSVFGGIIATQNATNQALAKQRILITNISSVIFSRSNQGNNDASSTLGGHSNSTSNTLDLIRGETPSSDFCQGPYI